MARVRIVKEIPVGTTVFVCCEGEGRKLEIMGDITLMEDGTAMVMDEFWGSGLDFFDTHEEAIRYVETRMVENPVYALL